MSVKVVTKQPEKLSNKDLIFRHGLLHHAYKKICRGKSWGELTRDKVVDAHTMLVEEMRVRRVAHHIADSLDNTLKMSTSSFFEILREFRVRSPFISVVGGFSNWGNSQSGMDFMLGASFEGNIVTTRTLDILAEKVGDFTLHMQDSKFVAPFSNYIPLYNLKLKFVDALELSRGLKPCTKPSKTLSEFMANLSDEDVVLFDDFVSLIPIGDDSRIEHIDVYFSVELPREMSLPIEFRIFRQFPNEYWKKFKFHYKEPPDDAIPYYALVLERINRGGKVFEMSTPPASLQQARQSIKADKVEFGRFFYPLKTSLSPLHSFRKSENFSVEPAVQYLHRVAERQDLERDVPTIYVEKKYDGLRCIINKDHDDIKVYTDSGLDKTWRFPGLIRELRAMASPTKCILDAECEGWIDGRHLDRETISGYVNASSDPDDSHVVFNVFDILAYHGKCQKHIQEELEYFGEAGMEGWREVYGRSATHEPAQPEQKVKVDDLHLHPLQLRKALLKEIPFKQNVLDVPDPETSHLNLVQYVRCIESDLARKALKRSIDATSSEGAMIKTYDSTYPLTGTTAEWTKLKKEIELKVVIWRKHATSKKGVYNYDIALDFSGDDLVNTRRVIKVSGKEYLHIGRTYNTEKNLSPGDIVKIRFSNLNLYEDVRSQEKYLSVYGASLHEARGKDDLPDSILEAMEIGRAAGLLHEKFSRSVEVLVAEGEKING